MYVHKCFSLAILLSLLVALTIGDRAYRQLLLFVTISKNNLQCLFGSRNTQYNFVRTVTQTSNQRIQIKMGLISFRLQFVPAGWRLRTEN